MPIDFTTTDASYLIFLPKQIALYKKVETAKSNWVRLSGPWVAVQSSLLELGMRISLVAESLFNGLANICGSPFAKSCEFTRGAKQLGAIPYRVITLFLSVIGVPIQSVVTVIGVAIAPNLCGEIERRAYSKIYAKELDASKIYAKELDLESKALMRESLARFGAPY